MCGCGSQSVTSSHVTPSSPCSRQDSPGQHIATLPSWFCVYMNCQPANSLKLSKLQFEPLINIRLSAVSKEHDSGSVLVVAAMLTMVHCSCHRRWTCTSPRCSLPIVYCIIHLHSLAVSKYYFCILACMSEKLSAFIAVQVLAKSNYSIALS